MSRAEGGSTDDGYTWDEEPSAITRARATYREEGRDVTTTYEPIDANTERVTYTLEDGTGHQYLQRWDCGLTDAPAIGATFKVMHEEWIRQPDDSMLRVIHEWVPAEKPTP